MRDPGLVVHAQRAAARLEPAWPQWRARRGLAVAPGQPVVSYAGWTPGELPGQLAGSADGSRPAACQRIASLRRHCC
jgi:hypothetical protein